MSIEINLSKPNFDTPFQARVVPVLDADGSRLWDATSSDADDLVRRGHATKYGSRRHAVGVKLVVMLAESRCAEDIEPTNVEQSALSPQSYGTRYTYEEHISNQAYIYQFTGFNRKTRDGGLEAGKVCLLLRQDFLRVVASIAVSEA